MQQEVAVQKRTRAVEVNRTRYASIGTMTHEAEQFGYRVPFDLCILVQKEDKFGSFPKRVCNPNIICLTKAEVLAMLDNFHAIDRSRYRGTIILRGIVDNYYANGMLATA